MKVKTKLAEVGEWERGRTGKELLKCLNCHHPAVIHGSEDGETGVGDPCLAKPKCPCPGLKLPGSA